MPFILDGLSCRKPLLPRVVVVADEFLLFCIHRNHRQLPFQCQPHVAVDMPELGVPIRVIISFLSLAIALQTLLHVSQQLSYLLVTDRMIVHREFPSQGSGAFARPAQRRFGIPSG